MGFVATIAHRHVCQYIDSAVRARNGVNVADTPVPDWRPNPEQQAIEEQHFGIAMRALRGIPAREREILERRYLDEQPIPQICTEMGMTAIQHRNLKHCALSMLRQRVQRAARVAS
jgi:DNA-directed RNA polymerase specialized sigma24 family protein